MRFFALVLGLGVASMGCGGAMSPAAKTAMAPADAPAPNQAGDPSSYASADMAPGGGAQPAPASASLDRRAAESAPSTRAEAEAPARKERPGLGTEWGESRASRIREVGFVRGGDEPSSVVSLHYNDRDGARALASFQGARPIPAGSLTALGGAVRVTLEGEGGSSLETFRVGDRSVVLGSAGQRYTIVLTNRTGRRFETVASVDGLDVISGRSASFEQRGYVLLPFATLRIEGFRQSDRAVAAFRFSKVSESYAAQSGGSTRNVGVIGLAFFRERGEAEWTDSELEMRDSASPFPGESNRFARPPR